MNTITMLKGFFSAAKLPAKKKRPTVASYCVTKHLEQARWIVIGVPDDRGVSNNYGRPGAKLGPKGLRDFFYTQAIGSVSPIAASIFDFGNLKLQKSLTQTLDCLKNIVAEIKKIHPKKKILVIGGGHDIAYGEIAGCLSISRQPERHHILNIDAHSDVRPLEKGKIVTSGTPFYRLIEEAGFSSQNYHPFGLQRASNSKQLTDWMESQSIKPYWLENMPDVISQTQFFNSLVESFGNDPWHLSVDMDAFPMSRSPGVSAPGVLGVEPEIFLSLPQIKSYFENLQSVGIYELAPKYDEGFKSQQLAAKLAYLIISSS